MNKLIISLIFTAIFCQFSLYSQDNDLLWRKTHKINTTPTFAKISNDEKFLILGNTNSFAKINFYDMEKNEYLKDSLTPSLLRISTLSINPKNEIIGVGYKSGLRVFYNFDISNLKENLVTPVDSIFKAFTNFTISPAGKYIYSYITDSLLAIWSGENHQLIRIFNKNEGMIPRSLYFSNDDSKAVFYKDSAIIVVDFITQNVIATFPYKSYLIPYALRLTSDNHIILADKYDLFFRKYDYKGNKIAAASAPFNLDNFEISNDGSTVYQAYTGYGIIFNNFDYEKTFVYKTLNPTAISKTYFSKNELITSICPSFIKVINIKDTSILLKLELNNFSETRYFDENNLYCLQTGGNIVNIDANIGSINKKTYEFNSLKFVPGNNNYATENYMQRALRVYKLDDLEGNIDSLRGFINIGNYNFSSDMAYLHISGTTSNYLFNFQEKKELWDKDSANVYWSGWKDYLITSYKSQNDTNQNIFRFRKMPENKELWWTSVSNQAKYMISNDDEYIYFEWSNGIPKQSIGWHGLKLSDGKLEKSVSFTDTLYGNRSKSILIRRDNHIFTFSTSATNPEFWIRNLSDGSLIYYNKCKFNSGIKSVSFSKDYQQFTFALNDGSLATYRLPDGILDIKENYIEKTISINPNPASDYMFVRHTALDGESIEIFNIFGESLTTTPPFGHPFELEGEKIKIDVSNLPVGVYFIKIGDKIEKFVKL